MRENMKVKWQLGNKVTISELTLNLHKYKTLAFNDNC